MRITFDPAKREWTLRERGLDFADATEVFSGPTFTFEDDRFDYPEVRLVTVGLLARRMIVMVWTPDPSVADDEGRRVISMRKANAREQTRLGQRLGQAGRNHR
jgi:uncharacterized DUF497 family protein